MHQENIVNNPVPMTCVRRCHTKYCQQPRPRDIFSGCDCDECRVCECVHELFVHAYADDYAPLRENRGRGHGVHRNDCVDVHAR